MISDGYTHKAIVIIMTNKTENPINHKNIFLP